MGRLRIGRGMIPIAPVSDPAATEPAMASGSVELEAPPEWGRVGRAGDVPCPRVRDMAGDVRRHHPVAAGAAKPPWPTGSALNTLKTFDRSPPPPVHELESVASCNGPTVGPA